MYEVIILAAGRGKRMGVGFNKQFIELQEKPIIIHTIQVFANDQQCERMIIVTNEQEQPLIEQLLKKFCINKEYIFVYGGEERQHSVYNGLKVIDDEKIVLIHDGARPFITIDKIHQLVQAAKTNDGAIVATPVKDTIKRVANTIVQETIERKCLWAVQTPQAFRVSIIRQAHEQAVEQGFLGTDDASLLEQVGKSVLIVEGDERNIKLTTPIDLIFAEAIIETLKEGL